MPPADGLANGEDTPIEAVSAFRSSRQDLQHEVDGRFRFLSLRFALLDPGFEVAQGEQHVLA